MKKLVSVILVLFLFTGTTFAAKYKVNTSGTVKTQSGTIITPKASTVNQNYYNNYQASSYVASNQVNSSSADIIEIVMDFSGSMNNWIEVAKRSMSVIVAQIPSSSKIGFRVFGHDNYGKNPNKNSTLRQVSKIVKKNGKYKVVTETNCLGTTSGACSATTQVAPIASANASSLISGMNSVKLGGATPLVYALDRTVYQDFAPLDKYSPKKIVLITDGGENCGGDPCAFARQLMNKRSDVHIDVVLVSSSSRALTCLSTITGGHFYTVDNLSNFTTAITESVQTPAAAPNQIPNQKYEYIEN